MSRPLISTHNICYYLEIKKILHILVEKKKKKKKSAWKYVTSMNQGLCPVATMITLNQHKDEPKSILHNFVKWKKSQPSELMVIIA